MGRILRLGSKLVLALLILLSIGLAFVLIPAHLQVRRVAPPLPSIEQLRALLRRADGPTGIRYVITSEQASEAGTLAHSTFIVEWANGNLFMIDAGMSAAEARSFGKVLERVIGAQPPLVHGTVAQLLARDVPRIRGVGYTHLHSDHSEGTTEFCAARGSGAVWVQTHWQAEEHNFGTRSGAALLRASCLQPAPLADAVIASAPLFPGLGVIALGGHTPDSTLFAVPVGGKLYLFSGDITNTKAEILGDRPKARLYSYFIVPENVRRSALLRRWLRELDAQPDMRVVVSHDLADIRGSGIAPAVMVAQ